MKLRNMLMTVSVMALLAGCEQAPTLAPSDAQEIDSLLTRSLLQAEVEGAIVRQQTLFPYHFVLDSAKLNELGLHDLAILAAHYSQNPGKLNVRKGTVSDELYKARTDEVVALLTRSGVKPERIQVADELAGGDGLPSDYVVEIMKAKE